VATHSRSPKERLKRVEGLRVVAYQQPKLLRADELRMVADSEVEKTCRGQLLTVVALKEQEGSSYGRCAYFWIFGRASFQVTRRIERH